MHRNPASSLASHLAKRRMVYPSPLFTAPHVMVIDVPPERCGPGLGLGRYYAIIIESEAELDEMEQYLLCERAEAARPDLLDHRPSNMHTETILISRYEPPAAGWPWLSVTRWPAALSEADRREVTMARGCYTMDMFDGPEDLDAHHEAMIEVLASKCAINVRMLSADTVSTAGTA